MFRRAILCFFICLVVSGCQTTADTQVKMNRAGSGSISVSVSLDQNAISTLPQGADFFGLPDLHKAGWTTRGPSKQKDGTTLVSASHKFGNTQQAQVLLRAVAKPFAQLSLSFSHGLFVSRASIKGSVDLTQNLAAFVSNGQAELLSGVSAPTLDALAGGPVAKSASISLILDVAGSAQAVTIPLGEKTDVNLAAHSLSPTPWWIVAGLAFIIFALRSRKNSVPFVGRYTSETEEQTTPAQ